MCEQYELLISRKLDNDLTQAEKNDLREHLHVCPSCRAEYEALSGVKELLGDALVEPPETLVASVMDRIAAYPAVPKRRQPWKKALIAACLAAVIGGGGITAVVNARRADSAAAAAKTVEAIEEYAVAMPAPMPEEKYDNGAPMLAAGTADAYATDSTTDMELPEPSEAERSLDAALDVYGFLSPYTLDAPASVPEGREADFETLLKDAHIAPPDGRDIIAYVEYRGVIYEFSTDGEVLVWRDAAEGMPVTSTASVEALLDITGAAAQ